MVQIVTDKNGKEHHFPDGVTPEQMKAAIMGVNKPLENKNNNFDFPKSVHEFGESVQHSFPVQSALGAIQGTDNALISLANLPVKAANFLTRSNIPEIPYFNNTDNGSGSEFGELSSIVGGPGLLRSVGKIGSEILPNVSNVLKNPMIERGIENVKNIFAKLPISARTAKNVGEGALLGSIYTHEHPLLGAVLGGTSPLAFKGVSSIYKNMKNSFGKSNIKIPENIQEGSSVPKAYFGKGDLSEFTNIKNEIPEFLKFDNSIEHPDVHASEIMKKLSAGESHEVASKNLASIINNTYNKIYKESSKKFNDLFNSKTSQGVRIGDIKLYKNPDPLIGVKREGKYIDLTKEKKSPFDSNELNKLNRKLLISPTIENSHELQSEIGSEIGLLSKQKQLGNLDNSGRKQLSFLKMARDSIRNDIKNTMSKIDSNLNEMYEKHTQDWKNEVIPYHSDKVLKDISQGKIKNPTTSQVLSIFKNPEDSINKVSSDIGNEGKRRISYLGTNKLPEESTYVDLLSARKSLEKKGISSYLDEDINQSFSNLFEHNNLYKENQIKNEQKNNLLKVIEKQNKDLKKRREILSKAREKGFNEIQEGSKTIPIKKYNALIDLKQKEKENFIKKLKYLTIGGASAVGLSYIPSAYEKSKKMANQFL